MLTPTRITPAGNMNADIIQSHDVGPLSPRLYSLTYQHRGDTALLAWRTPMLSPLMPSDAWRLFDVMNRGRDNIAALFILLHLTVLAAGLRQLLTNQHIACQQRSSIAHANANRPPISTNRPAPCRPSVVGIVTVTADGDDNDLMRCCVGLLLTAATFDDGGDVHCVAAIAYPAA